MSQQAETQSTLPDPVEVSRIVAKVTDQSHRVVLDFLQRQHADPTLGMGDMASVGNAFLDMATRMMTNPGSLVGAQVNLWHDYLGLWQNTFMRMLGDQDTDSTRPAPDDRRFRHDDWDDSFLFDFIKQAYLLTARWVLTTVREVEGLDEHTARIVDFYTRQFVDALSPTNFVLTNPEVLRTTVESGGQNLLKGLSNLLDDLERGQGKLHISMTDFDAFELGKNIATTPGKVVYQNELMQLVQYTPSTGKVRKRPLMVVPPWINKFYILDLQPKNSFIKWAVDQGHTVFVISWINPDESLAEKNFEDYLLEGPIAALDAIEQATGEREVNGVGYCLGGTLLAATLAYLAQKDDERIKSATFFTTMIDFSDPGELEVFIDEEQISMLERRMEKQGYLDGGEMAGTFSMLRANDLVWSFFINNYLLGKDPFPFDLLYWNSDSTRMPATMHSFYLRNMYQHNLLRQPGGIVLDGVPMDLGRITVPVYFLSTVEDHIAPWESTYAGAHLFGGPTSFVLGGSGHIAGVINPPAREKYGFWTNESLHEESDRWLQGATQHHGSWWLHWDKWVSEFTDGETDAREPGAGALPAMEDAPGAYVKVRLSD